MEAKSADKIPATGAFLFEPKWDGFRCLAFHSGKNVLLQSKAGQPLGRYFPELIRALSQLSATVTNRAVTS
jgi:ATP-dependent DNA ligase